MDAGELDGEGVVVAVEREVEAVVHQVGAAELGWERGEVFAVGAVKPSDGVGGGFVEAAERKRR